MRRAVQIAPTDFLIFLMRPWLIEDQSAAAGEAAQWPVPSGLLALAMRSTRNRMNCGCRCRRGPYADGAVNVGLQAELRIAVDWGLCDDANIG